MTTIDVTAIILALIAMVSGWVSFWLDRRKHRQEVRSLEAQVEGLKADNDRKYMELVTDLIARFRELIINPLEAEVEKLRTEVNELRDAIQKVNDCPLSSDCPVRKQLHHESQGDRKDADYRTDH